MSRVDVRLVELGLAPSRAKAQAMIRAGEVEIHAHGAWRSADRVSQPAHDVRVSAAGQTLRFVSRGGLKLDAALTYLNIDLNDARVLDVGQSTGGFTDCVLERGAAAVCGIDVGHGQLHASLRADPRVTVVEGVDVRVAAEHADVRAWRAAGVDFVTADLSFISLVAVLPALAELTPRGASALLLVKPQFEAGPDARNARGIVTDPGKREDARAAVRRALAAHGFTPRADFACALTGGDGNQEYFAHVVRG